jgi:hypothetical protein
MAEGFEEFDEKFARGFAAAFAEVSVVLDERARRLLVGAGARQLGRGGISLIANSTGISMDTVGRGGSRAGGGRCRRWSGAGQGGWAPVEGA